MSAWIDVKYIRFLGVYLNLFKEKQQNLWNFRCPICGDSTSDATKCRGYIYLYNNTYLYKCQRCGDSRPFVSLLYIISPELHKQHKMEVFKENHGGKSIRAALEPLVQRGLVTLPSRSILKDRISAVETLGKPVSEMVIENRR